MNVLHLVSGRSATGPAAAALTDIKAILAAGHRATLATRDGTSLTRACANENIACAGGLKLGHGVMRLLHFPHDARRLRAILSELAIDVLHVHRTEDQLLASAAIGRNLTTRLVRTWHRDPAALPPLLLRRLAAGVDACICVSRDHVRVLQSVGAPPSTYVPVAVDTDLYSPAEIAAPPAPPRIGQVGRWKREENGRDRGQRAALDVFEQLSKDLAWQGVLIGRGELAETLRRDAYETRKLSPARFELLHLARQSVNDFAAALRTLHLGLVFNVGSDGTSRTAAELLACGVPLLVADRPGLRELAEVDGCALRLLPDDARGWARTIETLLNDPPRLAAMSFAARQRAVAAHSLRARGEALAGHYALANA